MCESCNARSDAWPGRPSILGVNPKYKAPHSHHDPPYDSWSRSDVDPMRLTVSVAGPLSDAATTPHTPRSPQASTKAGQLQLNVGARSG